MSKAGIVGLGALTVLGAAAALNMGRTTKLARNSEWERGRDTMLSSYWPWDLTAAGSGLGLLGKSARDSATEALVLRAAVTCYVWFTLLRDWFGAGFRLGWFVTYTHWNFFLLAFYAPISLCSSWGAVNGGERHRSGGHSRTGRGREVSLAGSLTRKLFPLIATGALTVDIGYFVFLHGPIAAGANITGWQLTKAMDPSALCKHLLNSAWVLAELGIGRMEMPRLSVRWPFVLNCVYVLFAFLHNKFRGSWVYGPLAVPMWRVLFPLATLPVWALLAQLTVWRDNAAALTTRGGSSSAKALGFSVLVKAAIVAAIVAAPLVYLTAGSRRAALRATLEAAKAAAAP